MHKIPPVLVESAVVTATTVFPIINIENASKVTFWFKRANHSSGTSTFTVEGSIDGANYVSLNKLITNVANTNAQTPVRAASVALAADGTAIASLDLEYDTFQDIRVTVTEGTDGSHSYKALVEY